MFENCGGKIKALAKVYTIIGVLSSIIAGIIVFKITENPWFFLVIVVGGFLFFWVSALFIYGFGQLVSNSDEMVSLQVDAWAQREEKLLLELKINGIITEVEYNERIEVLKEMFE